MSKSRYLKASELGIPHKELRAFIWTKARFLDGTISANPPEGVHFKFDISEPAVNVCKPDHWCGTAACIGGWVGLKMFAQDPFDATHKEIEKAKDYVSNHLIGYGDNSSPKEMLFYENLEHKESPIDAANAIEEYLTTGEGT